MKPTATTLQQVLSTLQTHVKNAGLADTSRASKLPMSTVSRLMNGHGEPNLHTLQKLIDTFGLRLQLVDKHSKRRNVKPRTQAA